MDIDTFLRLAKTYSDLGWAVQDQLRKIVEGDEIGRLNPNAVKLCERFLRQLAASDVDGAQAAIDDIKAQA